MIRLKFKGQDGTEMPFEMPMNAKLYEYEMKYCQQFGKSFESCRFLMDGDRINKNQTPAELEFVPVLQDFFLRLLTFRGPGEILPSGNITTL